MINLYSVLIENLEGEGANNIVQCGDMSLTWVEVFESASCLAYDLEKSGMSSGGVIAIEIASSIEFVVSIIACIQLRLIIAPLSRDLSEAEFKADLEIVKPQAIIRINTEKVCESRYEKFTNLVISNCDTTNQLSQFAIMLNSKYLRDNCDARILEIGKSGAFIRSTSGTTGKSKGVMISFEKGIERIKATEDNYSLKADDLILSLLPLPYHFVAALLSFVRAKSNLRIVSKISNEDFSKDFYRNCTIIYAAPFHYDFLNGIDRGKIFEKLRLAISTSVGLFENTFEKFLEKFGAKISQSYGIIEVGILAANIEINASDFSYQSVGQTFSQFEVSFNHLDDLRSATLAVKGPGLFDCYIEPFKFAEDILIDGKFLTGDRVDIVEKKLFIRGRSAAVINVAGFKVFPEEIEETLLELSSILESRVYGVKHKIFENVLSVDIVLHEGASLSETEVASHCQRQLARYKIPKNINFVTYIKRNDAGKILR